MTKDKPMEAGSQRVVTASVFVQSLLYSPSTVPSVLLSGLHRFAVYLFSFVFLFFLLFWLLFLQVRNCFLSVVLWYFFPPDIFLVLCVFVSFLSGGKALLKTAVCRHKTMQQCLRDWSNTRVPPLVQFQIEKCLTHTDSPPTPQVPEARPPSQVAQLTHLPCPVEEEGKIGADLITYMYVTIGCPVPDAEIVRGPFQE